MYVGRPSKWGNPFDWRDGLKLDYSEVRSKELACQFYEEWVNENTKTWERGVLLFPEIHVKSIQKELSGKNLSCWCKLDEPCHADILLKIANSVEKYHTKDNCDGICIVPLLGFENTIVAEICKVCGKQW